MCFHFRFSFLLALKRKKLPSSSYCDPVPHETTAEADPLVKGFLFKCYMGHLESVVRMARGFPLLFSGNFSVIILRRLFGTC